MKIPSVKECLSYPKKYPFLVVKDRLNMFLGEVVYIKHNPRQTPNNWIYCEIGDEDFYTFNQVNYAIIPINNTWLELVTGAKYEI